ncbi:MAG: choice-of-anchor B family protein [Saprospirales bacterium]|nr:choice-of-anchor B family protein [Saprospirales bacterium]MBK8922163.1 choice-of-anchor B family protein [Saprospirales bacterium]
MRLLILLFLLPQFLRAQLQQIGHLPYAPATLAGCWHYVDNQGNEYALVGTSKGLSIVDVRQPAQPVERFAVPGITNNWREVKTWGHFAYVSTEANNSGITIVDLSQLPVKVNWKTWFGPGTDTLVRKSHALACADGYLYIFGGTQTGVVICDLADPWNPSVRSIYRQQYVHDGYIRGDTLWSSEIYAGQFSVIDVSDKAQPVVLATQPTPGRFNHNSWLSGDGRTLFTTDEKPNTPVAAFDISDLENIRSLDRYFPSQKPTFEVHNVRVINDFLINPSYGGQLTIVDAHRPDILIETAWASLGNSLVWDADPYLPSGIILATAKNEGLFIFQPNYNRAAYLEGRVTDAATGQPLAKAKVVVQGSANSDASLPDGSFKTGVGQSGTYTVQVGKIGYKPLTVPNVALKAAETTWLELTLERF